MTAEAAFLHRNPCLALNHFPCKGEKTHAHPLVLIHGWASHSDTWRALVPLLNESLDIYCLDLPGFGNSDSFRHCADPDGWLQELLNQMTDILPERSVLCGWSLGGMVATAFAGRFAQRVSALITIAGNPSFIARDNWTEAMAVTEFRAFRTLFNENPELCLKRFSALQLQGEDQNRELLRTVRRMQSVPVSGDWNLSLVLLGDLDNRQAIAGLSMPGLHLYGERDALVPVSVARKVSGLNPRHEVRVLLETSHMPQLSRSRQVADLILAFIGEQGCRIDKRRIADTFGRAAATYDSVAHLQRRVGQQLLEQLPEPGGESTKGETIADIGCGTGYFTGELHRRYPESVCIGLDLAAGMVEFARGRQKPGIEWLCGDAESLPLASASIGLGYSNFTFQWCQDLAGLMSEIHRVLKPGGRLVFSTVGPGSLHELREAWREVDGFTHVNRFASRDQLEAAIREAGLQIETFRNDRQVDYYPELANLTRELKCLGAHNINAGRNGALTGRRRIQSLKAAYERFRTDRGLPASWDIMRVVVRRPAD